MKHIKIILLSIFPVLLNLTALAQDGGFGILTIGPNTHALGINEAGTAALLGASDIYTNPANLVFESGSGLNADYMLWIGDIRNSHAAASFKKNNRAIAFGLLASEASDFELRGNQAGPSQGTFSFSYLSLAGAYAYQVKSFSLGASFQYLREEAYIYNASGFAINAGISSRWIDNRLTISAALQNWGEMDDLNSTPTTLPTQIRAGFHAYLFTIVPPKNDEFPIAVSLLSDVVDPLNQKRDKASAFDTNRDPYFNIGLNLEVADVVSLRGGYKTGNTDRPFAFGTGIHIDKVTADYAIIPFKTGFGTVHSIGLSYIF